MGSYSQKSELEKCKGKHEAECYFKDSARFKNNWHPRRDLYVASECMKDPNPVLCSEYKVGATRETIMRQSINNKNFDKFNNEHVTDAWINTALKYNTTGRQYYSDYVNYTERHKVRVRLLGDKFKNKTCQWNINAKIDYKDATLPCNQWFEKGSIVQNGKTTFSVIIQDTKETITMKNPMEVTSKVILGFGDSYASGEGVPDVPILAGYKNEAGRIKEQNQQTRAKTAAHWLDRNCHRSLLGSQFRAAIQYAASNPQTETIFLSYACSGAEISGTENAGGILTPYKGTMEHSNFNQYKGYIAQKNHYNKPWYKNLSQVNRTIIDICAEPNYATYNDLSTNENIQAYIKDYDKNQGTDSILACKKFKRDIDAVLLSVGGNDVGFSKVIFNATAEDWLTRIALCFNNRIATPEDSKKLIEEKLPYLYNTLADRFRNDLQIKDPSRIIIMQYPNPTRDESGKFCGHNREEHNKAHTLHPRLWFETPSPAYVEKKDSEEIEKNMITPLNDEIEKAAKKHGWTLAKAPDFSGHGWCATGKYNKNTEDNLGLPENFCPYNPYANVTRWLRTVNDSKLTQHAFQTETDLEHGEAMLAQNFYSINGFFHPNHLGSAAIADVYLKKLTEVLNKDKKSTKSE